MKVVKKINNNFAVARDDNLEELIIYGKGVGFPTVPYELTDLSKIERTYYNIDTQNLAFFNAISDDIILVASEIVDVCREQLDTLLNPNVVFALSDHIAFCIERMKKNIQIEYPLMYDLQQLHYKEVRIARDAVKLINYRLRTNIPASEAAGIAINIINNEMTPTKQQTVIGADGIIEHITALIEDACSMVINRDSVNYARYATHMLYFLQRLADETYINSGNASLLVTLKEGYPNEYAAAVKIVRYLESKFSKNIEKEELVYLMLHINRVCSRETLSNR